MLALPKSVPESQKYMTWAFPVLIAYGAVGLAQATTTARVGLVFGIGIVFTGWSSFAVVREDDYNDLLLVCDIALVTTYLLFLYYTRGLGATLSANDVGIWVTSTAIFGFYALWDFSAFLSRDTKALASALHLKKFGWICIALSIPFAAGSMINSHLADTSASALSIKVSRSVLFAMWVGVLFYWHRGRIIAAIADARSDI